MGFFSWAVGRINRKAGCATWRVRATLLQIMRERSFVSKLTWVKWIDIQATQKKHDDERVLEATLRDRIKERRITLDG